MHEIQFKCGFLVISLKQADKPKYQEKPEPKLKKNTSKLKSENELFAKRVRALASLTQRSAKFLISAI